MLSFQTFATLVQNMAAAAQASATTALNFTVGSVLRALMEAVTSAQLWLQKLVLEVLQQSFLSSCTGTQVDAWLTNNFPVFGGRLPATFATGLVTFSRFTAVSSALIVTGSMVRTGDGTQSFTVMIDTTNGLWNGAQNGYLIPAGTASGTVPVEALNAGTQGNVGANTISLVVGSVPGIDTVNNATGYANGEPAETDAAVKLRFQNWQETLASGTYAAVADAIEGVQQGLTFQIAPNQIANGTFTPGSFVATVDDGSGATPGGTISSVFAAVNGVRPIGSTAIVQAATPLTATIALTLTVAAGYSVSAAQAAVAAALTAFVNSLGVGITMPYSIIAKLAYDAFTGVTNVSGITLNGGTADLAPSVTQVVRAGTITVNP